MTRILNTVFGKSIGSSMLRNMYLSNKYSGIVEELKKDTKNMTTSVDVALNNYKTQGKYNSVVVNIDDDLMKVISLYLSNHPEKSKLKNKTYNIFFFENFL